MASKKNPKQTELDLKDPRAARRAVREFKRDKDFRRRDRSWRNAGTEEWMESNWTEGERVMPRGEQERRKKVAELTVSELGDAPPSDTAAVPEGLVIAQTSGYYQVRMPDGQLLTCRLRGRIAGAALNSTAVAVGDRVTIEQIDADTGTIMTVAPRDTSLSRPDPFHDHRQHVIVANIDQLVIVQAVCEPFFWHEMVDRYLVAASHWGVKPLLIVNKADLANEAEATEIVTLYTSLGVPTLLTSVVEGCGIDELRERLAGHLSAVAGLSGVGKSSLLREVEPGLDLYASEVSERRHEGRHTTTSITLHPLSVGGYVADTPGVRNFGLWDIEPEEIAYHFIDMRPLLGKCRFRDCLHRDESGCAIREAVEAGHIAATRYHSYLAMLETE
jgi:ribosome biogenesis GTPase